MNESNKKITKIELAITAISSLPVPPNKGFILGDSWHSAEKILKAAQLRGFDYIGALLYNQNALKAFVSTDNSLTAE